MRNSYNIVPCDNDTAVGIDTKGGFAGIVEQRVETDVNEGFIGSETKGGI